MKSERDRNLFLLLLSVAAGCVDAIAFIRVGVFPANMTGNMVVLATSVFVPGSAVVWLSALALLGFCLGAAGGAGMIHSPERGWSRQTDLVILMAAVLVVASSISIYATGDTFLIPVILATSAAMGLQSAAVQKLGISGVATVFMTGTLTAAVSRAVGAALDHDSAEAGRWLPALTWLSYFVGALLGGLHRELHTDLPLILPAVILVSVATIGLVRLSKR